MKPHAIEKLIVFGLGVSQQYSLSSCSLNNNFCPTVPHNHRKHHPSLPYNLDLPGGGERVFDRKPVADYCLVSDCGVPGYKR